ncbi:hypothetical protein GOP47_0010247 [Adiantum capillus-veneris]|uniref:Uncharacterized protein n=1 Tax=Adiantum capillus-veneris TaxID=13818 RepID=A0A9D4UUE2_ADICA|nr:hypothetical protein GOP47_0010247 [Adiantum capillus-veneris]
MVNFAERLESQRVPEWKHAFCDYSQLKKDLENIKAQPQRLNLLTAISPRRQSYQAPSFRQLGSLTRRISGRLRNAAVKVHMRHLPADDADKELYETELLVGLSHGEVENERIFFARLDGQLNKVNLFYKKKEQEFYEKADEIKQQLEKLVTMRKLLKEQEDSDPSNEKGSNNSNADSVMLNVELSSISENDASLEEVAAKGNMSAPALARDFGLVVPQDTPSLLIGALKQKVMDDISNHSRQPTADEVLPGSSFTKFDRKRVQYAEKTLRDACMELYRGLGYLRRFSSLNVTAFSKILKKYDKKTGRDASVVYMKVVEDAYFHSSDKVLKMMDGLEKIFIEIFTDGNHKRAMALLRPVPKSASHKVTFFLGLFTGFSLACLVAFFALLDLKWIQATDNSLQNAKNLYLSAIYPLFSIMALVLLHLCLYAWNLYSWREKRVNYAFIFGLPPGLEIKYRELLIIAMGLATLVTATLLVHFMIYTDVTSNLLTAIMPFSILVVFLLLLLCPLNICYRSTRFFFLTCLKHIVLAPFYKVVMVDFFLADQLTSQMYMFRNVEYVLCYSIFGHFKEGNIDSCTSDNLDFLIIAYVVSMVPYWWRLAQCIRRWIDERNPEHITNGVKYFSALVAAGVALTYNHQKTTTWLAIFIVISSVVAVYQLYWDLYKDWGLLRSGSKNYLLRDQLMLRRKSLYYASMGLNTILRFAWLQSVTQMKFFGVDRHFTNWFFASLEVVRRVHWNFYRLENEHLNNVGNFRATKVIPLPFINPDEDD